MKNTLILRLSAAAAMLSISLSLVSCDTPEVVPVSTTTTTQETTPATITPGYPASVVTPRTTTTRTTRTSLIPVDD